MKKILSILMSFLIIFTSVFSTNIIVNAEEVEMEATNLILHFNEGYGDYNNDDFNTNYYNTTAKIEAAFHKSFASQNYQIVGFYKDSQYNEEISGNIPSNISELWVKLEKIDPNLKDKSAKLIVYTVTSSNGSKTNPKYELKKVINKETYSQINKTYSDLITEIETEPNDNNIVPGYEVIGLYKTFDGSTGTFNDEITNSISVNPEETLTLYAKLKESTITINYYNKDNKVFNTNEYVYMNGQDVKFDENYWTALLKLYPSAVGVYEDFSNNTFSNQITSWKVSGDKTLHVQTNENKTPIEQDEKYSITIYDVDDNNRKYTRTDFSPCNFNNIIESTKQKNNWTILHFYTDKAMQNEITNLENVDISSNNTFYMKLKNIKINFTAEKGLVGDVNATTYIPYMEGESLDNFISRANNSYSTQNTYRYTYYSDSAKTKILTINDIQNSTKETTEIYATVGLPEGSLYTLTLDFNVPEGIEQRDNEPFNLLEGQTQELPTAEDCGIKSYKITGWYTGKTSGSKVSSPYTMPNHNVTLYARWEKNEDTQYKVNYEIGNYYNNTYYKIESKEEEEESNSVTGSNPLDLSGVINTCTNSGIVVYGFYSDNKFTNKLSNTIDPTLYTNSNIYMKVKVLYYTIKTPNASDQIGIVVYNSTKTLDQIKTELLSKCNSSLDGYTAKFYTDSTYKTEITDSYIKNTENVVPIYVNIQKSNSDGKEYTLTLNTNFANSSGNIATSSAKHMSGTSITLSAPNDLSNITQGYKFLGWYTAATNGTKVTNPYIMPTNNVTLYAHWEKEAPITITFMVDNSVASTMTIDKNSSISSLPNRTKTGYSFLGWYPSKTSTNKVTTTTKFIKNTTLYARFKEKEFTIKYNLAGGTNNKYNPTKFKYGKTKTLFNPSKEGYLFNGWYTSATGGTQVTKIDQNKNYILYARWTKLSLPIVNGIITNSIDADKVVLSWNKTNADRYVIQYATKEDFSNYQELEVSNYKNIQLTKLEANTTYYLRIYTKRKDSTGKQFSSDKFSNVITFTTTK